MIFEQQVDQLFNEKKEFNEAGSQPEEIKLKQQLIESDSEVMIIEQKCDLTLPLKEANELVQNYRVTRDQIYQYIQYVMKFKNNQKDQISFLENDLKGSVIKIIWQGGSVRQYSLYEIVGFTIQSNTYNFKNSPLNIFIKAKRGMDSKSFKLNQVVKSNFEEQEILKFLQLKQKYDKIGEIEQSIVFSKNINVKIEQLQRLLNFHSLQYPIQIDDGQNFEQKNEQIQPQLEYEELEIDLNINKKKQDEIDEINNKYFQDEEELNPLKKQQKSNFQDEVENFMSLDQNQIEKNSYQELKIQHKKLKNEIDILQNYSKHEKLFLKDKIKNLELQINQINIQIAKKNEDYNLLQKQLQNNESYHQMIIKEKEKNIKDLKEQKICHICLDKERTHMLDSCKHFSFCNKCAEEMQAKKVDKCPICKQKSNQKFIRIFFS